MEVHGFSFEQRGPMLAQVQRALMASGCWAVGYRRRPRAVEYSAEIGLDAAMVLYCGLVEAGLELTEMSHRVLTELCVLRSHEQAREFSRGGRAVKIRLVVSFVPFADDVEVVDALVAALA